MFSEYMDLFDNARVKDNFVTMSELKDKLNEKYAKFRMG